MKVGDKYHKNGKVYTITNTDDTQPVVNERIVEYTDSCGTKSSASLLYFLQNYSKLPSTLTIVK